WAGARINDVTPVAAARDRMRRDNEEEHRRLLYVAMTRAIDRLVVCGAEGQHPPPDGCWWDLVAAALKPLAPAGSAGDGGGDAWRYRPALPLLAGSAAAPAPGAALSADALPSWLGHAVASEPPATLPLSPSRAYDEATPAIRGAGARGIEREKAMARGV